MHEKLRIAVMSSLGQVFCTEHEIEGGSKKKINQNCKQRNKYLFAVLEQGATRGGRNQFNQIRHATVSINNNANNRGRKDYFTAL